MNMWERRAPDVRESIDLQALESFATSVAALAAQEARAIDILDAVLESIAENLNASGAGGIRLDKRDILRRKAEQTGYASYRCFERDLLCLIDARMADLRRCRLTASERAQKRLSGAH